MAEQELLERPRYQDYPQGKKDPAYHEAIARWNAQQRDEEYVPLDTQIEQQLAEDANFMEVTELAGNIPALSDSNTYGSDGTAPVEYIETTGYPLNPTYSDYSIPKQGTSVVDYGTPQGAGGFYAEQLMQEQRIKEFEEDAVAENIRYAELTDYERMQEDAHNPQDLIPLRQQNVDGLYAAYQEGNSEVFSAGFNASTSQDKISLYYKFYQDGTLDKQQYKDIVASQLQLDNPDMVYYYDDGDLFTRPKNNNEITGKSHGQIVLFPTDIPEESLYADSNGNFFNQSLSPAPVVAQDTDLSKDEKFVWSAGGTLANVDPLDDDSDWVKHIRPFGTLVARAVLAVGTGGQSETWYTLYKLANGETLHGPDYFNLIVSGLETAGIIAPPTTTIDPVTGVETFNAGYGLGNLDYDTTVGIMEYLGDGDIVNAALKYSGNDFNLLESTFEGLGITNETFGLDVEDWESILDKTQEAGFAGDSMEDVFAQEIGKDYLSIGEDAVKELLPEGETPEWVDDIVDTAQEVGRQVDENIIQPVIEPVKGVVEAGADVVQQVTEPVVDLVDEGLDYIGEEVVDPTLQAIDEALPHGETPEGPDVDGPDVDVDVELVMPERTPTENLFGDEIGKIFRTPIETYKPAFSQQEIQGMLSQRFRG